MRLLVDTQAWLWTFSEGDRLSARARAAMEDEDAEIYVSAVVIWEIVIKSALGKLSLPAPAADYVHERMAEAGHVTLPITMRHALAVAALPPHHKDPFDRMLVAQATVEGMTILTADRKIGTYTVPVLWD